MLVSCIARPHSYACVNSPMLASARLSHLLAHGCAKMLFATRALVWNEHDAS
jgi:hypothetical protein